MAVNWHEVSPVTSASATDIPRKNENGNTAINTRTQTHSTNSHPGRILKCTLKALSPTTPGPRLKPVHRSESDPMLLRSGTLPTARLLLCASLAATHEAAPDNPETWITPHFRMPLLQKRSRPRNLELARGSPRVTKNPSRLFPIQSAYQPAEIKAFGPQCQGRRSP